MRNLLFAGLFLLQSFAGAQNLSVDPLPAPTFKVNLAEQSDTLNATDFAPSASGNLTIEAGTAILLETTETIEAGTLEIGQNVQFKVISEVLVDEKPVINSGIIVLGTITAIESGGHSDPEEIHLKMQPVQAIDGQSIPIDKKETIIRGKYARRAAGVEPGMAVTAEVSSSRQIKVE